MGYTAACDKCGGRCDGGPALLGQFGQGWFRTSEIAGELNAAGYEEGDTVTLCGDCVAQMLL